MFLTILVIIYLFMIGYLGYRGWAGTKTAADYLLAGRAAHPIVMALSYGATFISTSAIVGFGGVAAIFGMSILWLTFLNIFIGIFIAFVFFGARTRAMGHHLDAHTFPELIGKRYDSKFLQSFSGIIILLFMPLYTAAVLMGAAAMIAVRLDVGYDAALLFFSAIVAMYVIMGGLKGVMYTDALQGAIMFIGMALILVLTYSKLGGVVEAHEKLTAMKDMVPANLTAIGHQGWTAMPVFPSPLWFTVISTITLGVGIGVLAQPQLAVRYMTVKSDRELNRAVLVGGVFILLMTGVAFVVGALSNVIFVDLADNTGTVAGKISIAVAKGDVESVIPLYIKSFMPGWLGDVFFVSLLAAAMSTVSSQFHAMGTAAGRDVYDTLAGSHDERRSVMATRIGILATLLFAVVIAFVVPKQFEGTGTAIIARATAIFFGLCATTFLPMYFCGLYWRGITRAGAIGGSVLGFCASAFWLTFVQMKEASALGICKWLTGVPTLAWNSDAGAPTIWAFVDGILIAFPLAVVATILLSLLTKKYDQAHVDNCFKRIR